MTQSKTKTLKETLNALILKVSTKSELQGPLEYQEEALIHLIHVQDVMRRVTWPRNPQPRMRSDP